MNTTKLYISSLCRVERDDTNYLKNEFGHIRYVLLKAPSRKMYFIDLNTKYKYPNNKYISFNPGEICLNPNFIMSFNRFTGNNKKYLSKRKVLSLYNRAISNIGGK